MQRPIEKFVPRVFFQSARETEVLHQRHVLEATEFLEQLLCDEDSLITIRHRQSSDSQAIAKLDDAINKA